MASTSLRTLESNHTRVGFIASVAAVSLLAAACGGTAVINPDKIAGLVAQWASGAGTALDLAKSIIGFPVEIDTPAGTTPFSLDVGLSISGPTEPWTWDWSYGARDPIAEIDSNLSDGGPGTVDTAAFYDPIMVGLGWHRAARVINSPGSGNDGPQSVNFAYKADFEELSVGDLSAKLAPGLIPVPVLATLVGDLPSTVDATLTDLSLISMERSPDSFDADFGLRYFEVTFQFDLPNGSAEAACEAYSTGLDGKIFQVGSANMSKPGMILPVTPNVCNGTWSQEVVVLGRCRGSIDVTADPTTGDAKASVRITLEPERVDLVP